MWRTGRGPAIFRAPGQVAQLVEQRTENPRVDGSIPPLATKRRNELAPVTGVAGASRLCQNCVMPQRSDQTRSFVVRGRWFNS